MENIKQNYINTCTLLNLKKCNSPFNDDFIKFVKDELNSIFPILNTDEKERIYEMLISLITLIFFKFNFNTIQEFYIQLNQNNNQDLKMIIFLLFPYMKDDDNYKIHKNIEKLSDLSIKKINNEYITNIQYDRYNNELYKYNTDDIINNYFISFYTIYKCAYHLYANWSQIIPYTLENYTSSTLYQKTIQTDINDRFFLQSFNYRNESISNQYIEQYTNDISYGGLDIREFYHVFINDLYLDILPYKWFLFEKYDQNKDTCYLGELFDFFGYIFDIKQDEDTFLKNRITFKIKWLRLIDLQNNFLYYELIYQILLHFDVKSNEYLNEELLDKYPKIIGPREYDKILELDEFNEEQYKQLLSAYNNDECIEYIYKFLISSIYNFSFTWYGKLMLQKLEKDKKYLLLKDIEFNKQLIFNVPLFESSYVSYKNIYNFIKSLLIYDGTVYRVKEWDAVPHDLRFSILTRINNPINDGWFNINNNLRKKYGDSKLDNNNIKIITNSIFTKVKDNITDIVFHSLISRGILTQFKPSITKKERLESYNGYYFVTQKKYIELPEYMNKQKIKVKFTDEIDSNIKNENAWFNRFSADWMQQIHFFKHFFNQRVLYVTGSTGVGKSTQIPKLLWYGLHLLGNYTSNVICSQPRTNATVNSAEQISYEMGVSIKEKDNYYIQYTTQTKKHNLESIDTNIPNIPSSLKIVSDGTLLQIIKNTSTLKNQINYKSRNINISTNQYDIICVDEAHEHNANMDLILTLMRDIVQLNNSLRLVIISATIDSDEPRYRRYYKNVEDDLLYPLNITFLRGIENKILNINLQMTNKISNDRRLHLSKPGTTTLFKIEDIYTNEDIPDYKSAEERGYTTVLEITKNTSGDILFFSTSKNKINLLVQKLNNDPRLPSNWIALPYYSDIPQNELYASINIINTDRKYIFDYIYNQNYPKFQSKYTRFILVSTNIAEASITINTLTNVIDTGYVISVEYNSKLDLTEQKEIKITESSRIQRRGRIGRTQDGKIYYMYQKDARKNILPKYPITQKLNELIYDLCDIISDGYINDTDDLNITQDSYIAKKFIYNNIINLPLEIRDQYYLNILNKEYINLNNDTPYCYRGYTGYFLSEIRDVNGEFYLIHPFESEFERDILTGLFINPEKNKKYIMKTYDTLFNQLFKLRLITIENNTFIKTGLWKLMNTLQLNSRNYKQLSNYNELWSLILACKYNVLDEAIWITNIIKESSIDLISHKKTSVSGKEYPDIELLQTNFGDKESDLNVYINIFNKLKYVLPVVEELTPDQINRDLSNYNLDSKLNISLSKNDLTVINNIPKKSSQLKDLIVCYKNIDTQFEDKRIENFCSYYGLDYKVIKSLIQKYYDSKKIYKLIKQWVINNNAYIPYNLNTNSKKIIPYIYISTYSNLNTIEDTKDIKIAILIDPYSQVKSEYIHSILKIMNQDNLLVIRHLSYFSYNEHSSALIPVLIYYLENKLLPSSIVYLFYKNITPSMLEKYLLPTKINNIIIPSNQIYNQQLLKLFELLRIEANS